MKDQDSNHDDRRGTPRMAQELSLYVEVGERIHPVEDISQGGVRFYSSVAYDAGAEIEVSDSTDTVSLKATVLDCEQVPMESTDSGVAWRVRGRFTPPVNPAALDALIAKRGTAGD